MTQFDQMIFSFRPNLNNAQQALKWWMRW